MLNTPGKIYVDTSVFYALLDRADRFHKEASALWVALMDNNFTFITSNYVVVETVALLQKKIGFEAARLWYRDILSVLNVLWVDADAHQKAYELWLNLGRISLSFVDCTSFVTMHHHQIERAFCFKRVFKIHGFNLISNDHSII